MDFSNGVVCLGVVRLSSFGWRIGSYVSGAVVHGCEFSVCRIFVFEYHEKRRLTMQDRLGCLAQNAFRVALV